MSEIINCLKRARIRGALHEPRARLMEDLIPGLIIVEGKYIATTNPCPREGKEFNRVYPFYEYVEQGYLTTTRCRVCSNDPFRPRVICPECLSEDLEWIDLPTAGMVEFVTEGEVVIPHGIQNSPNSWPYQPNRSVEDLFEERPLSGCAAQGGG